MTRGMSRLRLVTSPTSRRNGKPWLSTCSIGVWGISQACISNQCASVQNKLTLLWPLTSKCDLSRLESSGWYLHHTPINSAIGVVIESKLTPVEPSSISQGWRSPHHVGSAKLSLKSDRAPPHRADIRFPCHRSPPLRASDIDTRNPRS